MASEQSVRQVIMQAAIKTTKTAITPVREAETLANTTRPAMPKTGGSVLKQPMFNRKSPDNT